MPAPRYWTALDIGTNTVLALTLAREGCLLSTCHEFCETTRIGEGVDRTGVLGETPVQRTVAAICQLVQRVTAECPFDGSGIAVATSAVREARNRDVFLDACRERAGFAPYVISGEEEARLTFLGASSDAPAGESLVCLDIGGGSSELTAGTQGTCQFAASLPLGCVRFAERYELILRCEGRARDQAFTEARNHFAEEWQRLRDVILPGQSRLVVSGGTATTLAAVIAGTDIFDRSAVHGATITRDNVQNVLDRVSVMSVQERAQLPGLHPGRAPVFPAGLIILLAAMRAFGAATATVSGRGLRYGAILALQKGELSPSWSW